jgi:hypothetical protein
MARSTAKKVVTLGTAAARRAPASSKAASAASAPRAQALGPGLHAGTVELGSGGVYRVRTLAGARHQAALGDHVEPALVEECLRTGRPVLLAEGAAGPFIVGAIQTTRTIAHEPDGSLEISAKDLRLRADRAIVVETGEAVMRLERAGLVRIDGDKMVIDTSSIVKILAACVELP